MIAGTSAMEPDNGTVFVALLYSPPEKNALLAPYFPPRIRMEHIVRRDPPKPFHPSMLQHYPQTLNIPPPNKAWHTWKGGFHPHSFQLAVNGVSSPTILFIKRVVIRRGKSSMEAKRESRITSCNMEAQFYAAEVGEAGHDAVRRIDLLAHSYLPTRQ